MAQAIVTSEQDMSDIVLAECHMTLARSSRFGFTQIMTRTIDSRSYSVNWAWILDRHGESGNHHSLSYIDQQLSYRALVLQHLQQSAMALPTPSSIELVLSVTDRERCRRSDLGYRRKGCNNWSGHSEDLGARCASTEVRCQADNGTLRRHHIVPAIK